MSKYDDFDLDIQRVNETASAAPVLQSLAASCLPGICDTTTYTTTCRDMSCMCTATMQEDCSNTCSACHSYCGGVC